MQTASDLDVNEEKQGLRAWLSRRLAMLAIVLANHTVR